MLPAFPNITTQIELESHDVDLDDLKCSVLSNKLVISKWIQTTEKQLKEEIKKTKSKILTESKREGNYVDEILKEKLIITSKSADNCCAFDDNCKRSNLPYSNYCGEHIAHNKDQQLFRRCSVQLSNNDQCPNASLLECDVCPKHSTSLKENKQESKAKRKYLRKQSKNATNGESSAINHETINNLKIKKSRKKKEDKLTNDDSLGDCLAITLPMENFNNKSQPFIFHSSNPVNYPSNDLNENNFSFTEHGLIDYAPCINNSNNDLNNLNQLSNLNNSEDSLVAIVNNSDLTSIPFEESELSEMLGKIGKIPEIPEDAFNDLFMDNLNTESNELRAIENVEFNDTVNNIEPSISNQTFSSSLNFKNNSTYFTATEQSLHDGLMYNGRQEQNIDLNNLNNAGSQEMVCLPNNLISTTDQIKSLNDTNHFGNAICGLSNLQNGSTNAYAAFNVIDYKQIQSTPYPADLVHPNYTDSSNHFSNPSYPNNCLNNFASSNHLNVNQSIVNSYSNSHFNNSLLDANYSGLSATNLSSNLNQSANNLASNLPCLDVQKNEAQDKKFNLFSNCKNNKNYSSTYSNIYDDLPSFEANRVNGASLPSFSIMRKNRIESR